MKKLYLFLLLIFMFSVNMLNAKEKTIRLEQPKLSESMSFKKAVSGRKSVREFSNKALPSQEISNILWTANGFNRPDKKTVPTAMNTQNIDLYVILTDGIYFYDSVKNVLDLIESGDFRELAGLQDFTWQAPLTILMVANYGKIPELPQDLDREYSLINIGYVSQNIYLYASANDFVSIARGMIDKEKLSKKLKLAENQEVLLAQSVGYKK